MASRILAYPESLPAKAVASKVGSTPGAVRVVRWRHRHPDKYKDTKRRYYAKWLSKAPSAKKGDR